MRGKDPSLRGDPSPTLRVCEDLDFAMASAGLRTAVTDWMRSGALAKRVRGSRRMVSAANLLLRVILSAASLRAESKDLAPSPAHQTKMSDSSTDDPTATASIRTQCQNPEIVDYARRTARDPSTPAAFAQDDRRGGSA